jgi:AGCS family alanine or glycine:cation symporter
MDSSPAFVPFFQSLHENLEKFFVNTSTWLWEAIPVTIGETVYKVPLLLILLGGTGVFLTFRLRLIQLFKLSFSLKLAFGRHGRKAQGEGDVTHFQSLMTALAATIGTGNIVGVATAVGTGGPGALFWLWIIAFVGMATKYAEGLLAVKYRVKDRLGKMQGGPMYYIERGMGANWKWLAVLFAIFGSVAAFGIGNMVQANAVAKSVLAIAGVQETLEGGAANPDAAFANRSTGGALVVLTALVILGGIKSIGRTSAILVPFMAIFYIAGALFIILRHAAELPVAFALILSDAFTGTAATGGFAGAGVMLAIRMGVARGVFSNESGLGSAPIAAAAAQTKEPVEQAAVSMTGTFIDSIIVCTMTGLALVLTGVWTEGKDMAGAMTQHAFSKGLPGNWGGIVVGIGVLTFAYSTIVGWAYYGERCLEYLLGEKAILPYRILWIVAVYVGCVGGLHLVWNVADTLNALMALPNLIALIALSGVIVAETRSYFEKHRR